MSKLTSGIRFDGVFYPAGMDVKKLSAGAVKYARQHGLIELKKKAVTRAPKNK